MTGQSGANMLAYYFMLPAADDVLLLTVMLLLLIISTYIGSCLSYSRNKQRAHSDIIITAGTLALSMLFIGFAFSVAINGFTTLKQAQVREAQSIEKARQYTLLLPASVQQKAQGLLCKYLDERIHFFRDSSLQGERSWNRLSEVNQKQLWLLAVSEAILNPTPIMDSLLSAYSELKTSQQQSIAMYRRKIPDAAWLMIIVFAMAGCALAGKLSAGARLSWLTLLILPVMISLLLFLVAEIDLPGEGVIRVTPDDLEHVVCTLAQESTGDPVYHIH
jgi:hypothetical protein